MTAPAHAAPVEFPGYRPLDWTKLNDIAVALPEDVNLVRRVPSSEYEAAERLWLDVPDDGRRTRGSSSS